MSKLQIEYQMEEGNRLKGWFHYGEPVAGKYGAEVILGGKYRDNYPFDISKIKDYCNLSNSEHDLRLLDTLIYTLEQTYNSLLERDGY